MNNQDFKAVLQETILHNLNQLHIIPNIIKNIKVTDFNYGYLNNTLIKFHTQRKASLQKEIKDCQELLKK